MGTLDSSLKDPLEDVLLNKHGIDMEGALMKDTKHLVVIGQSGNPPEQGVL